MGWLGVLVEFSALWLLWRAHTDLGRNWSPTLEINQVLVSQGVYQVIRPVSVFLTRKYDVPYN